MIVECAHCSLAHTFPDNKKRLPKCRACGAPFILVAVDALPEPDWGEHLSTWTAAAEKDEAPVAQPVDPVIDLPEPVPAEQKRATAPRDWLLRVLGAPVFAAAGWASTYQMDELLIGPLALVGIVIYQRIKASVPAESSEV